uniref:Uncharacterized protein n=1 Tax=Peronospora matthiolae TaxID=2874970 RepID=A0AAV1T6Q7_9STRA
MSLLMSTVNLQRAKCRLESYWRPLIGGNRLADRLSFLARSSVQAMRPRENSDLASAGIASVEKVSLVHESKLSPTMGDLSEDIEAVVSVEYNAKHDGGSSSVMKSRRCSQETETRGADLIRENDNAGQDQVTPSDGAAALESPTRDQPTGLQITTAGLQQVSFSADTTGKSSTVPPAEQTTTGVSALPSVDHSVSSPLQEMPFPEEISRVAGPTLGSILQRIHLNDGDVSELDFSALSQHNKRLESEGCALVARSLTTNCTVRKLIIRDHDIGDGGAVALSKMLCINTTLEYLELTGNNISDRGAEALAQALYGHDSLTHLCLENNWISDRGAEALAQAIRCNCTLKSLGLVHNRITGKGAQALLDALDVNMHLEIVNLGANDVPTFVGSQLAATLARNRAESLLFGLHAAEKETDEVAGKASGLDTEDEDEDSSGMEEKWESDDDGRASSGFQHCSEATDSPSSSSGLWI